MTKTIPQWLSLLILVVAFLGFIDATFLASEHFLGVTPPCFITSGCDTVTTSSYSKILGVPVSFLGVLYYLTILGLGMYFADKQKVIALKLLHIATGFGLLFSAWLFYIQGFVLNAWCVYCLISGGISVILFSLCACAFHKRWENKSTTEGVYRLDQ